METGQRIRPNAYRTPSGAAGQTDQAEAVRGRSCAYALSDRDAAAGKGAGGVRLPFACGQRDHHDHRAVEEAAGRRRAHTDTSEPVRRYS
jgi:hypothetical protein